MGDFSMFFVKMAIVECVSRAGTMMVGSVGKPSSSFNFMTPETSAEESF